MKIGDAYYKNRTAFKVLLVEDNAQIASKIQLMLHELPKVEVVGFAANIKKAFSLIIDYQPDLVVLDIQLEQDNNNKSGINLLEIIRSTHSHIVVIMFSNHSESKYVDYCLKLGARYFLDKSLDFEKLPEKVMEVYDLLYESKK